MKSQARFWLQVCVGARGAVHVHLPWRRNTTLSHGYYFTPPQKATRTRPLSTVLLDAPTCSSVARAHKHTRACWTDVYSTHVLLHSAGGVYCTAQERRNRLELQTKRGGGQKKTWVEDRTGDSRFSLSPLAPTDVAYVD